jgi:hypothetical protein
LSVALEGLDVHGGDCNGSFLHAFLLSGPGTNAFNAPARLEDRLLRAR